VICRIPLSSKPTACNFSWSAWPIFVASFVSCTTKSSIARSWS